MAVPFLVHEPALPTNLHQLIVEAQQACLEVWFCSATPDRRGRPGRRAIWLPSDHFSGRQERHQLGAVQDDVAMTLALGSAENKDHCTTCIKWLSD